jgi:chromosome segregation ATPase
MYKTLAIVLLFATLAVAAPHRRTATVLDTKQVLAEIDQDKFGSTILSTVALNIAVESPFEEITLLIDEILTEINNDQAAADEKNRTDQATFDETINGLVNQIREHKDAIETLTSSIKDNEEILQQAKIDLNQANQDYDETIQAIETGTAQREAEHSRWADEDYENSISIATLEEGVKLINHIIHGVAFAQIKSRYDKVLDKLRDNQNKHASLFKPLITSLTQLATKLNYENVIKILELLQNIRNGIVEEQTISRQAEERAQADWEVLLTHLTQQKQSLTEKINRLNALIQSTTDLLGRLNESLEFHTAELAGDESTLAAQKAW